MWARSPVSPSETSSIALATPRSPCPSVTRGSGRSSLRRAAANSFAGNVVRSCRTASASIASPSVPETQTSSPGTAPLRRIAWPIGTSPAIVRQRLRGPRVVSPPINVTSCSSASANSPRENASSQRSIAVRQALPRATPSAAVRPSPRRPRGSLRAPCARAIRGSVPERKCRDSTIMSTASTSSCPSATRTTAASSPTPSATRRIARRATKVPLDQLEFGRVAPSWRQAASGSPGLRARARRSPPRARAPRACRARRSRSDGHRLRRSSSRDRWLR